MITRTYTRAEGKELEEIREIIAFHENLTEEEEYQMFLEALRAHDAPRSQSVSVPKELVGEVRRLIERHKDRRKTVATVQMKF